MNKIKKRIASIACAFAMMLSSVTTCSSAFGAETETDTAVETTTFTSETVTETSETTQAEQIEVLTEQAEVLTEQSISLYPDGEESEQVITLNGLMPAGATAEALNVTLDYEEYSGFADDDSVSSNAPSVSVLAAYDITITSDDGGFQPDYNNPIFVEITDSSIVSDSYTELWHIMDDGSSEKVYDFTVEDGKIQFYAAGFSVYAVVQSPEIYRASPVYVSQISDFTGENGQDGFYLAYNDSHYFTNTLNRNNCLIETTDAEAAAIWYFEEANGGYLLYTYVGDEKLFLHNKSGNLVELSNTGDILNISEIDGKDAFYLKKATENKWLQHSNGGGGIRYYTDNNNAENSNIQVIYPGSLIIPNDYYELDGKSFGLVNYVSGPYANALMAEPAAGSSLSVFKAYAKVDPVSHVDIKYIAEGSDISEWTFHNVSKDVYKISTEIDGVIKYLNLSSSGITLVDETNASDIKFTPGTGTNSGKFKLSCGNYAISYNTSSFKTTNQSNSSVWLNFAGHSDLSEEDFVSYSATKVGISDEDNNTGEKIVRDGSQVIIYTRKWDDNAKQYKFYAIDHDGSLVPVYDHGDAIMWIGSQINTLLWDFTVYTYDDGTENNYYEFYNPYSQKYIAPQITGGQILSDSRLGVNLTGRRNGEYYTSILAWDETVYTYAGVRADDTVSHSVVSCNKNKADTFYFAMIDVPEYENALTTVSTIDNNDYGISMRMIDYSKGSNNNNNEQYAVLADNNNTHGLLTSDLKANGYPDATKGSNKSLFQLYENASEVNHLFLSRTYEESGYFEFDSCQNFATLIQEDGTVGTNFIVYNQLGTSDKSASTTLKHGQFFPYDSITPGEFSTLNPVNLYSALADRNNENTGALPDSDPRKYERLYSVPDPNYYNGMELSASFVQTPSGQDRWGHDMIFEFTGDDDFWLYVDGELILDLGGIHSALAGSVNFATGKVVENGRVRTLRQVFSDNYMERHPDATTDQLNAYLADYFEEGENIFKDYSSHTMKIFYMERGAGASNLHMRFNLSSVKPGQVRLSKEISTDNANLDLDYEFVEYPFQIWYKLPSSDSYKTLDPLDSTETDYVGVYYENSTKDVSYLSSYTPPGGSRSYSNVFFLSAGESVFIDFPEDIVDYYIVECGIDTNVYDVVKVNGDQVTGTGTGRKDFNCGTSTVRNRPAVTYDNHVSSDAIRDLSFTKKLYDANEQEIHNDTTTFDFRLYLGAESTDFEDLAYANMHRYRVISPDGKYCSWSDVDSKFVETGYMSIGGLTQEQLDSITFYTSPNGSISKIPAWYKVQVIDLPVGTKFKVEENFSETPLGYDLIGYERVGGTYIVDATEPSNTGIVRANSNPEMYVKNQRGLGISAEKVWADRYSVSEHEPVYLAIYEKNGTVETLVNGTLKQLKAPASSVKWYLSASSGDLSDYVVREVKPVSDPVVDVDGNVTSYSGTVIPVLEGTSDTVTVGVRKSGSDQMTDKDYFVSYHEGTVESSAAGEDLQNIRTDIVTNTPDTKGVRIRLSEWNGTAIDRDFKTALPNGTFTLELNGDTVDFGEFTSDENGLIAVLYDYEKGENNIYTLTQTGAPVTWVGTDTPIRFYIEEAEGQDHIRILNSENDGWVNHKDISSDDLIGDIIIYNKKLSLNMIKYAAGSNEPLARAEFELYRGTKQPDGSYLQNYYPLSGYETLVSGADGVIPKIDETLPANRYFLREKRAPNGYERFADAIEFSISPLGEVELVNAPIGVFLDSNTSQDGRVIVRIKAGNTRKDAQTANLTVMKKVEGAFGDKTKDFAFTLTVKNAADEYFMWTLNEVTQESIRSGDTFHLTHGDTAVFILPLECEVTITEEAEDYTAAMQLNHAEAQNTDTITFTISATTELLVTNTRNGVLPTGIPGTLCKALLLFVMPMMPIGLILYSKRKRKRTS